MTKSKKQFAAQQSPGTSEEFGRTVELTFVDHPWPASRTELLEHASRQQTFAKSDLARLKQIPHRDYHSIADLMQAAREAKASTMKSAGPVATAEHNRRAMDDVPKKDRPTAAASSSYDEQMR